jgi:DNA primase
MVKSTISDYTIKAVKDLSFISVLERESVEYKKIGREAITLCPWHNDRNPSLTINDEKGFCYCFVCQTGSDAIGFIQAKLGLSFSEAIQKIAVSNEIEVIYENIDPELAAKEAKRKAEILGQLQKQQQNYRNLLRDPRAQRIRDFIDDRKILPETCRHFGLGYCSKGFFADRVTIPIHDHIGNLVGFSGRATRDSVQPKYKNTESNEYFDKSRLVFNEHRAAKSIKESDSVIFVEGHFDVISMHQYGITNVVAMQGTSAPSEAVIYRLSRKTKRFILCYDADAGGTKAIEQFIKTAGPMACRGEITISIAHLPEGTDPDQCIRENLVDLFSIIENSSPWLDWQLDVWLASIDRTDTARFSVIESKIRELVDSIQSPVLRQYYIDKASKALSLDQASAIQIAKSWSQSLSGIKASKTWQPPTPAYTRYTAERRLIRMYIHYEEVRQECRPLMDRIQSPVYRWAWARVREIEQYGKAVSVKDVFMSVLVISEPHYMRQLRPIVRPTINVTKDTGILEHIKYVLSQELTTSEI